MSWALWITGLPGSGKSVLARAAAETLRRRGVAVTTLELDVIRKIVTPAPTYRDGEREAVYRLLAFMAASLVEAGVPVIVDATAHRRRWRDLARELIPRFAEVQLECPLAVARERETRRAPGHAPAAIYARAGTEGATVPGVDQEYERARHPELVIDTTAEDAASGSARIVALAETLGAGAPAPPRRDGAWAVWITGRPGSGKTTVARHVTAALAARGVVVRMVEANRLRRIAGPATNASLDDLVHRAVVCLAKLLVEAGIAVIVDATAHQRRWRDLARASIPRFAEIQLACPADVCADRQRAARWHLGDRAPDTPEAPASVEPAFEYEPALRPELTIYTDVQECTTAADQVLFVAERLHRASPAGQQASTDTETPPR